jgi:hypothetical protein
VIPRYYLSRIKLVEYRKYIVIPLGGYPRGGSEVPEGVRDFSMISTVQKNLKKISAWGARGMLPLGCLPFF